MKYVHILAALILCATLVSAAASPTVSWNLRDLFNITNANTVSTTTLHVTSLNTTYIKGAEGITILGTNSTAQTLSSAIFIFNPGLVDDSTGARGRTEITWCPHGTTLNTCAANKRGLSIQVHENLTQPKQVTFYSDLNNALGYSSKAFEWDWGPDADGKLHFEQLNGIHLPESWNGYYDNESATLSGIYSDDPLVQIVADWNANSSNEQVIIKASSTIMGLFDANNGLRVFNDYVIGTQANATFRNLTLVNNTGFKHADFIMDASATTPILELNDSTSNAVLFRMARSSNGVQALAPTGGTSVVTWQTLGGLNMFRMHGSTGDVSFTNSSGEYVYGNRSGSCLVVGGSNFNCTQSLSINGAMQIIAQASPPANANTGTIYVDTAPALCYRTGSSWVNIGNPAANASCA